MSKKEIIRSEFPTNRLVADWQGAALLKERYSLVCFRHANGYQWNHLFQIIGKASLEEVLGWTIYDDDQLQPVRWYIMLVAPENRESYMRRVSEQDPDIQCHSYADPTQCPYWEIVMLRLFVNSLRHVAAGNKIYTHFGNLLVILPDNFGVEPVEDNQLLGLSVELNKYGNLVCHTRTFTQISKPLKGRLRKKALYSLDPSIYKLAPVLSPVTFTKGKTYYIQYNRNKEKHNVIPQYVFSHGNALNCKERLIQLVIRSINQVYGKYVKVEFQTIAESTRVGYNYFNRMAESVHAELGGTSFSIADVVGDKHSEHAYALIKKAILDGDYFIGQVAGKHKQSILTWEEDPDKADLVLRLVRDKARDDKEDKQYLSLFMDETCPVTRRAYQHLQIGSNGGIGTKAIKSILPRVMAELTIKRMIMKRRLADTPQLIPLRGWEAAVGKHCDDQGNLMGGILRIGGSGELTLYLFGEPLTPYEKRIEEMGARLLLLSPSDIEELLDTKHIGGKGPFYRFQVPGAVPMTLEEQGEVAMPNSANISAFLRRMETEVVCTFEEVDQAMAAVGIATIPPYREQFPNKEELTAVDLETVVMILKQTGIESKQCMAFRSQLPGLRRSNLKNLSNIEIMLGALTDIHYWMEGEHCRYVSTRNTNLNMITPTTSIVGLPHVRTIRTPWNKGYLTTESGQTTIVRFMESLTHGFGRMGDGSVYPMPFKLLEEWMDQILLSTLGKHWSAISSKKEESSDEEETDETSEDEEDVTEEEEVDLEEWTDIG